MNAAAQAVSERWDVDIDFEDLRSKLEPSRNPRPDQPAASVAGANHPKSKGILFDENEALPSRFYESAFDRSGDRSRS
jgi:hypothetical protein